MNVQTVVEALIAQTIQESDDPDCSIEAVIVFLAMVRARLMSKLSSSAFAALARTLFIKTVAKAFYAADKSLWEINMLFEDPNNEAGILARIEWACATLPIRQQIRQCCLATGFRFADDPPNCGKAFILAKALVANQAKDQRCKVLNWMPMLVAAKRFKDVNTLSPKVFAYVFANMHDTAVTEAEKLGLCTTSLNIPNLSFRVLGMYATEGEINAFITNFEAAACAVPDDISQVDRLRWNFILE